jgi:hypothetical protein
MTAENFGESKESIGYQGPSGTAKTHNLLTWPTPIKIAYFDKNLKTVAEAVKAGLDAEIFIFDTAVEFENEFVRKVRQREFDAQTIGVDTFDFMAAMVQREIQGSKARMTQPDWGTFLNRLRVIANDLTGAAAPLGDKPSYNIVFNYHLTDVTNDGNLVRVAPKIQGGFKDELESYLDTILHCTSQISSTAVKQPGGGTKMVPSKQFVCHSVPPNPFITCKGGGLPPTLAGDYPTLRKAWDGKELESV